MKQIFIIEHLEPEIGEWTLIEYKHISKIVGKSQLWVTNLQKESDQKTLAPYGKTFAE